MFEGFKDRSDLAKASTVLLAIFITSLGLCGMNAIAAKALGGAGVNALVFTGFAELAGILLSLAGLLVVALIHLGLWIGRLISSAGGPEGDK